MAHVYGHADCTIAYLLPPQDVFAKPRQDPRIWSPCIFRRPNLPLRSIHIRPDIFGEIRDNENDMRFLMRVLDIDWLSPRDWPLFTRAWVCQEYLLSPRIVFVGHRNLMWECSSLFCDELLGPITQLRRATASKTEFSAVKSVTLPVKSVAAQLLAVQNWGKLVCHYRAGMLTQPKDRVMAFAGIAQAVQNSSGMAYLAGSWAQLFPFSFAWSVTTMDRSIITEVEPAIEGAPSWSWFSIPVFSDDVFEFEVIDRLLTPEIKMFEPMYQATLLSWEDRSQQACADASPTKAFYDLAGMALNISMKTWSGFLDNSGKPNFKICRSIKDHLKTLWGQDGYHLQCYFDHRYSHRDITFGLLIELRTVDVSILRPDVPALVGLLMEKGREAYKRIGLWTLYLDRYPLGWDAERFDSASIFDQLEGVRSDYIMLV